MTVLIFLDFFKEKILKGFWGFIIEGGSQILE